MEFKTMETSALEERKVAISEEMEVDGADLDALLEEVRSINEELESRKAEEAKKVELREMVAQGAGEVQEEIESEEKREETENMEVRNSKAYIDAFANYIKTDDDSECRSLLSTNATGGQVPVPEIVETYIRTAWERATLMNRVRKTYLRGNVKVGFELSATGAGIHIEGDDSTLPAEEVITMGVIEMIPRSIKKWITISDEAIDLGGAEFLRYIYDEITYRIAEKAEEQIVQLIKDAPTTASANAVSVAELTETPALDTFVKAVSELSSEARNSVIVMNKATYATFKALGMNAKYAVDPFDGLQIEFNNYLPAYNAANSGDVYAIVGDFGVGAQANFPNGDEIRVIRDDYSLAEKDLVKFVGREFVGLGLVADKCFARLLKA